MDLENMKCNSKKEIFHNKCKFCGKYLKPIGLDYLYANIPLSSIEYERCDCKQSKDYWNEIDLKEEKMNDLEIVDNGVVLSNIGPDKFVTLYVEFE